MTPEPQPTIIVIIEHTPAPTWFKILMGVWIAVLIGVAVWTIIWTWKR